MQRSKGSFPLKLLTSLALLGALAPPCAHAQGKTGGFSVEDDRFSADVTVEGPLTSASTTHETHQWAIRSWVNKKTGGIRHQLVVSSRSDDGFQFFAGASDEDATPLEVVQIGLTHGGVDSFGAMLPPNALQEHATKGYSVKFRARTGAAIIVTLSSEQIQAQLQHCADFLPDAMLNPEALDHKHKALEAAHAASAAEDARQATAAKLSVRLPSVAALAVSGVTYRSQEVAAADAAQPLGVLAVVCNVGHPLIVVGSEFRLPKHFPNQADVRYDFDGDSSHWMWPRLSETEASPIVRIDKILQGMATATMMHLFLESQASDARQTLTFQLPSNSGALRDFLGSCH